jgi:hypothetical protein
MAEQKPSLVGDPDDPVAFLKEFFRGEVSFHPDDLSKAYLKLAEERDGVEKLAYSALSWSVATFGLTGTRVSSRLKALEEKVKMLESRLGS